MCLGSASVSTYHELSGFTYNLAAHKSDVGLTFGAFMNAYLVGWKVLVGDATVTVLPIVAYPSNAFSSVHDNAIGQEHTSPHRMLASMKP